MAQAQPTVYFRRNIASAAASGCDSLNDSSLKAYWKLDEASGDALDSKGTNTLTETSGTIDSTTGKLTNARDFEAGDTEWFEVADNTDLSAGDIDFTFGCWVKAESLVNFPTIANKGWLVTPTTNSEWRLLYSTGVSRFIFSVCKSTTAVAVTANNFGAASTGTWYHICVWHDSVNDQTGISVNAGTPDTASTSAGVNDGTSSFQLGAVSAQSLYWDGLIDEAFFTKRVLTSGERTALYNAGAGCLPSGL